MSLLNFLKTVGHDIKTVAIKVAHAFETLFGAEAAQEFGQAALGLLKSDLGKLVVAEVETLAGVSNLSGAEKAIQAQKSILQQAESLGISTSVSIVNMLIELAVQFIKGNLSTLP